MRIFRSVREILDENSIPERKVVLYVNKRPDGEHACRHNLPENLVMWAIVIGDVAELVEKNDIVLERKSLVYENSFEKRTTINQTNQAYDPLCHPLQFTNGQNGWHSRSS